MKNMATQLQDDLNVPNPTLGIFLISILGLLLETLFIRWIGTEIRIFAYLQNTIVVVCFLGLGLGAFTSSKPIILRQSLIPMLILLVLMAIPMTRVALGHTSEMLNITGGLLIWYVVYTDNLAISILVLFLGLVLTYSVLIFLVDIFVPLGRILGRLMNEHPKPIWAYSVNVFGSILGTWAFVLLSFFYQPPLVWFSLAGILLVIFIFWARQNIRSNLAMLASIIILSWFAGYVPDAIDVVWSPYQKLIVRPPNLVDEVGKYVVTVNNVGYQAMIDLSGDHVSKNPEEFDPELQGLSQYDIPLLLHPHPEKFLVVGAGTGNDVAAALRHNVQSITAVEIDPAIIAIGREMHPEQPYSSSNVTIINDDARSFFAITGQKFDVISFGLLDSHTTTAMTNARLDHYVYTRESITQAKSLLADGGILVLTFEAQKPYIADRMDEILQEVFDQKPTVFRIPFSAYGWGGVMFVAGDQNNIQMQLNQNIRLHDYINKLQGKFEIPLPHQTKIVTDDWPYIYLESPKIPTLYFLLIGLMALIFFRSYKKWQAAGHISSLSGTFWHFFFLGAAFLLLEVQNISKASVVLGNTWQVNAVIISSILGMALLANWIAYQFPKMPASLTYIALIGTCIILYFVDLARFGFLPYFTKAIIVGALTSLPMLFSGIVFIRSFAVAKEKSSALGANLIGALVGALLQSITFITGIKALLLVVACFYLLSLLTMRDLTKPQASPVFPQPN